MFTNMNLNCIWRPWITTSHQLLNATTNWLVPSVASSPSSLNPPARRALALLLASNTEVNGATAMVLMFIVCILVCVNLCVRPLHQNGESSGSGAVTGVRGPDPGQHSLSRSSDLSETFSRWRLPLAPFLKWESLPVKAGRFEMRKEF